MTCYWQNKYIVKKMKDKEEKKIEKDNGTVYRIGIIGTGRIAARFLAEAREVKAAEVTIVYNPKRESAQKFEQQWNVQSTDDLMLFMLHLRMRRIMDIYKRHCKRTNMLSARSQWF